MYELFEKITLVYSVIISICVVVFPFTIENDKFAWNNDSEEGKNEHEENMWKKVLRSIILLSTAGICILGIIWLVWNKEYSWLLLPIMLLTFFERMNETYVSMGIVRKTLNSNGDELLSINEQVSIMTIAFFIGMLNLYKLPVKCLQIVEGFPNEVIADALLLAMLILFVTVYYFFIGAMLLIPIKAIIRLGRVVIKRISSQKMTLIVEGYRKWHQQIGNSEYISIKFLEWGLKEKWRLGFAVPLLIFTIVIDILFKIAIGILKIILLIGEHILNGFIRLIKVVIQFSHWVVGISDRRMVILLFRSALIFSLTSIVIVNRYIPIIKKYEEGTAVLEFLASAIVIPLVLSWIMDYRNKSNLENQDN